MRMLQLLATCLLVMCVLGCQGMNARLGYLPVNWTSTNQLYADVQRGDPTAIAQLQLELLAKDLLLADELLVAEDQNYYPKRQPFGLEAALDAGLLFDWPVDPAGQFLAVRNGIPDPLAATPTRLGWTIEPKSNPQSNYIGSSEFDYFVHGVDPATPGSGALKQQVRLQYNSFSSSNPLRPINNGTRQMEWLTVAPGDADDEFRFHCFYSQGEVHALQTAKDKRLYAFGRYLQSRLEMYLAVFGQYPADWSMLLDAFHLQPLTFELHATELSANAATSSSGIVRLQGGYHSIEPVTLQFVARYVRTPPTKSEEALLLRHVVEYQTASVRPTQILEPTLFPRAQRMRLEPMLLATLPPTWSRPPGLTSAPPTTAAP